MFDGLTSRINFETRKITFNICGTEIFLENCEANFWCLATDEIYTRPWDVGYSEFIDFIQEPMSRSMQLYYIPVTAFS